MPGGAIPLPPGAGGAANLNTIANASSQATFWFETGLHNMPGWPSMKGGQRFLGAPGAILDGMGTTEFAFYGSAPDITVRNLEIRNFNNPIQLPCVRAGGHSEGESTTGWQVVNNNIHNNVGGIRIGSNMLVQGNKINDNYQIGIGGIGNNSIMEYNEIARNNAAYGYNAGFEAGGSKWVLTNGLIVRRNFPHHNGGPGLWTDIDNDTVLYEENLVEDNGQMGIFHEISWQCLIRFNKIRRNGFYNPVYAYGAGILCSESSNVEAHGNFLQDNWNELSAVQGNRVADGPGKYGTGFKVRNLYYHDNTVVKTFKPAADSSGNGAIAAGLMTGNQPEVFTSENNRFEDNDYYLSNSTNNWFAWDNGNRPWGSWNSYGNDTPGGTLTVGVP